MFKRYRFDIFNIGTGAVGSTSGTLIGGVIGGPAGAITGGIVANLLQAAVRKVVKDQLGRTLSTFEELRTDKVLLQVHTKVIQNLSQGRTLRQDAFFYSNNIDERSAAEEIFEGVLLAAQREYEEKKIKFEGNLFANIAFDSHIDRASANFLLRLAQRLSYRQLCIMALFLQQGKFSLRKSDYRNEVGFTDNILFALLQEIYELYTWNMLAIDGEAMVHAFDIIPDKMVIYGPAKSLYFLMGLEEIEQSDINALAEQLSK